MQAVLFADRSGKALMPLTEHTCAAMLPVVGKPLIVFALEDLTFAGLREALVVLSPHADLVEQELGDGARWGMRLEYVLARPDDSPERVVRKVIGQLGEQFLMMRGDMLRTPLLKEFLTIANTNRPKLHTAANRRPSDSPARAMKKAGACWAIPSIPSHRRQPCHGLSWPAEKCP